MNKRYPFTEKQLRNGQKIYVAVEGKDFAVTTAGNDNNCDFTVPFSHCKFTGLEIIGASTGDMVKLQILDDANGTYSTVANYVLNQFGGKNSYVNVAKDFYSRESGYDADLYTGMVIRVIYKTISDKSVYINYLLHEVV